jgi:hypothetical protein
LIRSCAFLLCFALIAPFYNVLAQLNCQLSGTPATISGSLTLSDALQAGRVVRDGVPSTCDGKANVLQNSNGVRFDAYNYVNSDTVPVCVRVDVDFSGCGNNQTAVAAYSSYDPISPGANLLGDMGLSTIGVGSFSFPVAAGAPYTVVVHEIEPNAGCAAYSFRVSQAKSCRQPGFDLWPDGRADLTMFNPSNATWRNLNSYNDTDITVLNWGSAGDKPVVGDFTGDGSNELGIFRPSLGQWWYYSVTAGSHLAFQFGANGDVPVPGDYDGDYKTDIAIFRPTTGEWYVLRSSDYSYFAGSWGQNGDRPQPGDYDGDGKGDFAIWRPTDGGWYILASNFSYEYFIIYAFGISTDKPVPADYDGDSRTDIGVYRPSDGTWYYLASNDATGNPLRGIRWGVAEDIPQPADYDGDKRADITIFRPSTFEWYILQSSGGYRARTFGLPGELPVSSTINY